MANPHVPNYSLPERNRRILLVKRPSGIPQASDFAIDEVFLEPLKSNEFRVRNIFLSVDPAQKGWASAGANYSEPASLDSPMRALAVGVIVESLNEVYPQGTYVYGWFGWQVYATASPRAILTHAFTLAAPLSAYAGILGINGLTASLALNKLGHPAALETILISTAAGAVGSAVGQLARRLGMRTIGLTGTDDKVSRLLERFRFDVGINYKRPGWERAVQDAAPDGISVYFDNVGGEMLDAAMRLMRAGGRIIQCGTASLSSWAPPPVGLRNEREVLTRRLTWSGFIVFDHAAEFPGAVDQLARAIARGDLVYDEDVETGIEAAPAALSLLYAGENKGKKLIYIG